MTDSSLASQEKIFAPVQVHADERVLILTSVGQDGPWIARALQKAAIPVSLCNDFATLSQRLATAGAATLVLTTEALDEAKQAHLTAYIKAQPAWSDLPILLLVNSAEQENLEGVLPGLGNVTVLERPVRLSTLLSAVRTALRARRRQHEVHELLSQSQQAYLEAEQQQAHIELLNQRLQRAMTETHHRVKNNLQIILAMIDMQALEDTPMIPMQEFKRLGMHVRTLVAVHDLLTRQAKVDGQAHFLSASDLLEQLLPLMQQLSCGRHIRFDLEDAWLSARQGTSLALVVNELVNNALKYSHSEVSIVMRTRDNVAIVEICDDGPGFSSGFDPATAAHTGLELVGNLIRWDLQGQIRYWDRPEGGGCVTITLPLNSGN